jgi:hypothetical protein
VCWHGINRRKQKGNENSLAFLPCGMFVVVGIILYYIILYYIYIDMFLLNFLYLLGK